MPTSTVLPTIIGFFMICLLSCAFSGNLVDWWEPETKKKYLEKAQCIIEQYGNYTVEVFIINLEQKIFFFLLQFFCFVMLSILFIHLFI